MSVVTFGQLPGAVRWLQADPLDWDPRQRLGPDSEPLGFETQIHSSRSQVVLCRIAAFSQVEGAIHWLLPFRGPGVNQLSSGFGAQSCIYLTFVTASEALELSLVSTREEAGGVPTPPGGPQ